MGTWEIMLIIMVALLVLGPKQLPQIAKWLGQLWHQGQGFLQNVQTVADEAQKQTTLQQNISKAQAVEKDNDDM